jgi:hypothetical protein
MIMVGQRARRSGPDVEIPYRAAFEFYEFSIAGKWLALLKQIAPAVRRVAAIRDAFVTLFE